MIIKSRGLCFHKWRLESQSDDQESFDAFGIRIIVNRLTCPKCKSTKLEVRIMDTNGTELTW
jgi:hypothetical protein